MTKMDNAPKGEGGLSLRAPALSILWRHKIMKGAWQSAFRFPIFEYVNHQRADRHVAALLAMTKMDNAPKGGNEVLTTRARLHRRLSRFCFNAPKGGNEVLTKGR